MKKILSLILSLALVASCAFSCVSFAEEAASPQQEEFAAVMEWLAQQIPQEEMNQILTWDKDAILEKLEGYDQPLSYTTKEEIADQLAMITGLFGTLVSAAEEGDGSAVLLGGLFSGAENTDGASSEGFGALAGLFGMMMGGAEGDLDWSIQEEDGEDFDYGIDEIFNGTFWENGEWQLEAVWQDGYYKVAVRKGDTELSYLCEYADYIAEDAQFSSLNGIGTGDEEQDATQPDHGKAAFIYDWRTDELIWKQSDGTETRLAHVVDPLDGSQWFADGKIMTIRWLGDLNYEINMDGRVGDFTSWNYQCVLDEETDTLTGTGIKVAYGDEIYTDSQASFALRDARRQLIWTDEKEPDAASGLPFEAVAQSIVNMFWENDAYGLAMLFVDGYYDIHVFKDETDHGYLCTYDWNTGTFTAVDPATIDFDALSLYLDQSVYTSTGTFVLEDEEHLVWHDHSDLSGDGVVWTGIAF